MDTLLMRRAALLAAAMTAITAAGSASVQAAPVAAIPEAALASQSDVTSVRWRRHHNYGNAFAGAAVGVLALGLGAALANGYDDNYYDYPSYGGGYYYGGPSYYYRSYPARGYGGYYGRRQYGWGDGGGRHRGYGDGQYWRHSNRVGRN